MKKQTPNFLASCRYKVLVASITACSTWLIATSVSQASDIDIYQNAKSGDVTLMFMLDISTSMRSGTSSGTNYGSGACDLPSGATAVEYGTDNVNRGGVSYTANYCMAIETKTYRYRKEENRNRYSQCTNASESRGSCTWGARFDSAPNGLSNFNQERSGGYIYYYEGMERKYYDRISRLKEAMLDLLDGNATKNIVALTDDKVIGLSTLGASLGIGTSGMILMPARALSHDVIIGGVTKKHRQLLKEKIASLQAVSVTPTTRSYGETVAYLMGTTSVRSGYNELNDKNNNGWDVSGFRYSDALTKSGGKYISPSSLNQDDNIKQCSGQGVYVLTDGDPNYNNPSQSLIRSALGASGSQFSCNDDNESYGTGWDCTHKLAAAILDPTKNPKQLIFKTAVVGFGNSFNSVPSFDKTLSEAENVHLINASTASDNQKQAALWGVRAEGGWYSGNSSQDVVDSVNDFISTLSQEIPSVTTGSPTIPRDALNPAELQDDAYYQTFQPTPNTNYQLWLGNLKKYHVSEGGILVGKSGERVFNTDGSLVEPTINKETGNITSAVYDLWAKSVNSTVENADENTVGSRKFSAKGGAWSQLVLGAKSDKTAERKLFTNRKALTSGTTSFGASGDLRQIQIADLTDATYKLDSNRGYLVSLLGYNIDVENPPTTVDSLISQPALRQMGAVMHSEPVLITNKGKLQYNAMTKAMESKNRKDYILFGTTQGLLHVVDANTGAEKFAFVPNEMVENQKEAFRLSTVTTGGMQKLFYGIDGAWSLYTQYVVDKDGNLVVGEGRGLNQTGMQVAYGGLRMGGRSYYALDLADIDNPELKFHIDPATQKVYSKNSSKTFSELQHMGQSWSKPAITWINWGGTRKRVMFVGGGYDAGGDDGDARANGVKGLFAGYESASYQQTNKKGAGVYMFDADNGELLWWASDNAARSTDANAESGVIAKKHEHLKYSVVSEVRTVDRDGDELVDHIYFGDLGGQLFRVDFDNKQNKIGAIAKDPVRLFDSANVITNRSSSPRFYEMPSFSLYSKNGETFAVVSIGSGNRSAPLQNYTSTDSRYDYDAIYNIYDKDVARRDLFTTTNRLTKDLTKTNLGEITEANRFSNLNLVADYQNKGGWFYRFQNCTAGVDGTKNSCSDYKKQSEKVFGKPLAMNYKLYVSTFDSSKPGISGDCGAGVKGESMITAFCLPFGQCAEELDHARSVLGVGIHTVTVGGKKGGGTGSDGTDGGNGGECVGEDCPPKAEGDTSAKNYCISTSGRIALTVTGGFGEGEATEMCLIPQRWYEKFGRRSE